MTPSSNISETMNSTFPSSVSINSSQFTTYSLPNQLKKPRTLRESHNKIPRKQMPITDRPELLSTTQSDRVAVLDKDTNTYCVYSAAESVEEKGLSFEQAEAWVSGHLLVKKKISVFRALQVIFVVSISWASAVFTLWALYKVIF